MLVRETLPDRIPDTILSVGHDGQPISPYRSILKV